MYIVIVGAGRVGESVARWAVSAGHEVSVLDSDPSRCLALDEVLGSVCVVGDGTSAVMLDRAGTGRADAFIATTGRDDVNLVCCQLARHHSGVARCISVINNRDHVELFGLLGIDVPIDVTELVLGRIQEGLSTHGLVQLMRVSEGDGKMLVAVKIPPEPSSEGRSVRNITLPNGTLLSLVIGRDGSTSIPDGDTIIRPGDEVIAVTTAHDERDLWDILVEGSED